MTLIRTMETMHAPGRRRLPPVPRPSPERAVADHAPAAVTDDDGPITDRLVLEFTDEDGGPATARFQVDFSSDDDEVDDIPLNDVPVTDNRIDDGPADTAPAATQPESDAAQEFVARLRSAAAEFAEAAGAASAVVREAVPPARHRRARCRVVLRYADDTESDVTFLGPAGSPVTRSRHGFDRQIRRWLGAGQRREEAWVVADPDSSDGVAVDVTAWLSAG